MKIIASSLLLYVFAYTQVYGQLDSNFLFVNKLDSLVSLIETDKEFDYFYPVKSHKALYVEIDTITNENYAYIGLRKSIVLNKKTDAYEYRMNKKNLKKSTRFITFKGNTVPVFFTNNILFLPKKRALKDDIKWIGFIFCKLTKKIDKAYIL